MSLFVSVIVSRILPVQAKRAQIGLLLALLADGFKLHIPRSYIQFAAAVELFNVFAKRNRRSPAGRFRPAS
jgi:hypothetical protein